MRANRSLQALILGGSSSIGCAIARSLAADGFEIHLTYHRNLQGAQKLAEEIRSHGGVAELHAVDAEAMDGLKAFIGDAFADSRRLGVVVNCIGVSEITSLVAPDALKKWARCVDVNMNFMFTLANLTLPLLIANGRGRWINISSVSASEVRDGVGCYSVTKAAQNHLVKFFAKEAGPDVTVNSICPGMTYTPHLEISNRKIAELRGITLEQINAEILSATATKRFVDPDEIGAAVSYLCSPAARSITGVSLNISGGRG